MATQPRPDRPTRLYRYCDMEAHAEAMLRGDVWISTLQRIRTCDAARADPADATLRLRVTDGVVDASATDEKTTRVVRNLHSIGLTLMPGSKFEGFDNPNIILRHVPADAYVFCASTLRLDPYLHRTFGKYCVEILEPTSFWEALQTRLNYAYIDEPGHAGYVQYGGRDFAADAELPASTPFLSVPSLEIESEYRLYWPAKGGVRDICPMQLHVRGVAELCRRIA